MMNGAPISTAMVSSGQTATSTQAAAAQVQLTGGSATQGKGPDFLQTLQQAMTLGLSPEALIALQGQGNFAIMENHELQLSIQALSAEDDSSTTEEQMDSLLQLLDALNAQLNSEETVPAAEETWILVEDILEQIAGLLLQKLPVSVQDAMRADHQPTASANVKEQISQLLPLLQQLGSKSEQNSVDLPLASKQQLNVLLAQLETVTRHIASTTVKQNVQPVIDADALVAAQAGQSEKTETGKPNPSTASTGQSVSSPSLTVVNMNHAAAQASESQPIQEVSEKPAVTQDASAAVKEPQVETAVNVKTDVPVHKAAADVQANPTVKMHAHQFAEEMSRLVKSMNLSQQNGMAEAKIILMPETLGQVEVRISMQNGVMTAQFVADTMLGKDALETQLLQLRASLQQQGLQVDKLEVTQSSVFAGMNQEQQRQGFTHQSPSPKSNKDKVEAYEQTAIVDEGMDDSGLDDEVREGGFHATA
ncbi:flagellar hook-length control protein FliK [Marinicrinis lubricantis]|uniref:Flagellar hook-length control protein FliK n=1 Tax=Marinicrinis lubricantis TaxID=2086470 RepID=A0ABW1IMH6_9BACL